MTGPGPTAQATVPEAEALAERMLAALGGREAWARTTRTVNDSQQNRAGEPPVVRSVITMDFERPRLRIDALLAEDRRFYAGHVYRTLHRIACRDPALQLSLGPDGRLEVHERGARIAWVLLDGRGEPYRYGAHDDDAGTIFGPWEHEQGGIRHPVWVSSRDGTWRAMLKSLRVNVELDPALFEPPAGAVR